MSKTRLIEAVQKLDLETTKDVRCQAVAPHGKESSGSKPAASRVLGKLHHGVEKELDPALLKWLVQHGASPEIEDHDGVTLRLRASRKRDKRFFEALA